MAFHEGGAPFVRGRGGPSPLEPLTTSTSGSKQKEKTENPPDLASPSPTEPLYPLLVPPQTSISMLGG